MFSTTPFLYAFLPASLVLYFAVTKIFKGRTLWSNLTLCVLSTALYIVVSIWSESFSSIIFLLIPLNYLCSLACRATGKRWPCAVGIVLDTALLVWYKYASGIASLAHITLSSAVVMPLGLSFIVFHCISYLADVSATHAQSTERAPISLSSELGELTNCATYLLFFPKLFQGPIVRWKDFSAPVSDRRVSFDRFESGLERFLIGLGKKILLADEFGRMLNWFPGAGAMDAPTAWLGMLLFAMQMYFDFSGYSDMAIGLARFFGFELKENFDHPYLSTSVTQFWRRWHISLGAWFREYVYIPLGGNRRGNVYVNLLIVFILTGLWHGNALVYLFWGLLHGAFVLIERTGAYRRLREKAPALRYVGWLYTTAVVFFGWLCFRYESLPELLLYLKSMFSPAADGLSYTWQYFYTKKTLTYLIAAFLGIFAFGHPKLQHLWQRWQTHPAGQITKYIFLLLIAVLCYIGASFNTYTPFLYFQY